MKSEQHLFMNAYRGFLLCLGLIASLPTFAQTGPTNINISGGLYYPNGNPIFNPSVNFHIEVYDKTGTCLLYSEDHLGQDLSSTKGGFSLELGLGTSINNAIDSANPNVMTSKVFENSGTIAGGWAGCDDGATLASGDNRLIRVQYDLGSGYVAMTPDVPVGASAYSIVAETLQGKRPSDFIQVHDDITNKLTQANVENVFSSTNYPKLDALLQGSSSQYMPSTPTSSVGFNNQRITDLSDPTAAQDAATKNYADANIGGQSADVTGIGPATGDGYTLIWDQGAQKWTTGVPSAIDSSKLPLAGGTMSGTINFDALIGTGINLNGNDLLATGNITMSPQKVFNFGTFTTAEEATLVASLTAAQTGASWYNSSTNEMKIWDGTAAITQLSSLTAAGGDLTGTYPNPTIANDKITSVMIDSAGVGLNRLVISDQTTGAGLKFATCGTNEVLRYEDANGWVCRDPSTIVTFPVTKVNGKTGDVVLNPVDLGLGTAALENVGTGAGEIPQLDGSGKIPTALLPVGTGTITEVAAGTGLTGGGTSGSVTLNLADTVVTPGPYGAAGKVATFTVDQQGRLTAAGQTDISVGDANITGVAGSKVSGDIAGNAAGFNGNLAGDVTGPQGTTVVEKIQGRAVSAAVPNADEVLMWNDGTSQWEPTVIPAAPVSSVAGRTGAVTLDWGDINSASGKYMTYKPDNTACGNDELLKYDGTNWVCTSVASILNGDYALSGANTDITSLGAVTSITSTAGLTLSSSSNGDIVLQPNGTGLVTTSSALRVAPTTLPGAPTAGTIAFDSGAANALKYYNGSAWQTVNTTNATGDFMKDGSVAMTGDFNGGAKNLTNIGTNINAAAGLTITTASNGDLNLAPDGTGLVTTSSALRVTPTSLPGSPTAGTIAFDSGAANALKYYNGSAWQTVNTTNATGDFMKDGSVAMTGDFNAGAHNLTNIGTNVTSAAALTLASSGTSDLTLTSASGILNSTTPLKIAPTTLPGAPAAGTIAFDSGAANAMKYFDGSAWISIGSGTGDFLRNGSLAMTGDFDGGTHNITNIGSVSGSNVSISSTGANNGITLTPNGTGLVTTSSALRVTPTALPGTPAAGTIAFDSGASNTLKYYNGSAWQTVNTTNATGDFMKDGSVAMTGDFDAGTHNLINIGTNITGADAVTLTSGGTADLTLTSASGVLKSTTPLNIAPASLPGSPSAGTIAFDSSASNALKFYNGSAWQTVNTTNATGDFMKDGSIAMTGDFDGGTHNITNIGSVSGSNVSISSTGANNGITLTPNGTGLVTTSSALRVTPTALPGAPAAGTIAFDSGASNTLKYYNGSAWQTVNTTNATGDFMKDGSVAMTGDFDAGTHNLINIGTNITGADAVILASGGTADLTLTSASGVLNSTTPLKIAPATLPGSPAAGTIAFDSSASNALKYYNGSAWQTVNTSNATGDFMKDGSVAMTGDFDGGTKNLTNIGANINAAAGLTITTASNNDLNLAPNGTGLVTTSSALRVTPTTLPAAPSAGTIAMDSSSGNAMKYYDGSAWQTLGTGTGSGDFMKNGSIAMTGDFDAGTHNLINIGTNITGADAVTLTSGGTADLTLTSASGVLKSTTPLNIAPASLPGSPSAGTIAFDSGASNVLKYYNGSAWQTVNTSNATGDFMKDGSVAMTGDFDGGTHNITNIGSVSGSSLSLSSTGANNGITLTPNGTGIVTSSSALRVTPTTLPAAPAAGTIAMDSSSGNAMKYYDGSAWQTLGTGTGSGDFMKNGSIAMTGDFDAGTHNLLNIGTNITGADAVTLTSGGTADLTLTSASGVLKSTTPLNIAPATLPGSPAAGTIAFDSSASNALKYYNGSAWQTVNTSNATGDFMKDGSVAMTGDFDGGTKNLTNIGANINAAAGLTITTASNNDLNLAPNGTGLVTTSSALRVTPTTLPAAPSAGTIAMDSSSGNAMKYYDGSAWQTLGTGTGSGDFMKNGSVAMTGDFDAGTHNLTNIGTNVTGAAALTLASSGISDLTLTSASGILNSTTPLKIAPATLPGSPAAGTIAFDSSASNALKFYNGSAWQTVNTSNATGDFMKDGSVAMTGDFDGGTKNLTNIGANINAAAGLTITTASNSDLNLAPNGTGLVTTSSALRVTPTTLPATPSAGTIAMDSSSGNAMKYYDGAAWQTLGTGTGSGDFLRDGSLAMTGHFNTGGNSILGNTTAGANLNLESTSDATKGFVNIQPNGGNVGIGTSTPERLLHVNGPMRLTPASLPTAPAAGDLAFDSDAANALKFYDGSAWQTVGTGVGSGDFMKDGSVAMTGNLKLGANYISNDGGANEGLAFDTSGNANFTGKVGIGTTSSGKLLEVADAIAVEAGSSNVPALFLNSTTANSNIARIRYSGNQYFAIRDEVAGADRLYIAATGNVGIGTTSPAQKLEVSGNIKATGNVHAASYCDASGANCKSPSSLLTSESDTLAAVTARGATTSTATTFSGGLTASALTVGGNVTFSSANPTLTASSYMTIPGGAYFNDSTVYVASPLQVRSSVTNDSAAYLTIGGGTSGYTYFNGKVGIGTTAPNSALDVQGNLSGGIGAADTSGTLDWNDTSNTRSGSPKTLLLGTASNGPGASHYFHPFNFEYGTKNGGGQVTQFAIPYADSTSIDDGIYMRGRYSSSWTSWRRILSENSSNNVSLRGALLMNGNTVIDSGGGWMRTYGATGWYNGTYGGGMYMTDSSYVRVYGGKVLLADNYIQSSTAMYSPAYYYTSDRRLKQNIREIASPLDKVLALRGVEFDWKKDNVHDIGFIAQEVEKVLPDMVKERADEKLGTAKTVKYGNIVAVTVEAIKELWNKFMNHEDRIQQLEKENLELKARLERLEKRLDDRK